MAERSLSMREAPGSIPGLSKHFRCRGELGWRWGQTSNLVRADALEVRFLLRGEKLFFLYKIEIAIKMAKNIPVLGRCSRPGSNR